MALGDSIATANVRTREVARTRRNLSTNIVQLSQSAQRGCESSNVSFAVVRNRFHCEDSSTDNKQESIHSLVGQNNVLAGYSGSFCRIYVRRENITSHHLCIGV